MRITKRRSKLMVAAKARRRIQRGESLLRDLEREMDEERRACPPPVNNFCLRS
jgi:hypothetical protein